MLNLYGKIVNDVTQYRQFNLGESLITMFNCPLENKYQDMWSKHNYILYVIEGRKIWHTTDGSYDLKEGNCMLVRKGACIVEQFFDVTFCLIIFFVPDDFICEVLKTKTSPVRSQENTFDTIMQVQPTAQLKAFFNGMLYYFQENTAPDQSLLQLKFRELILAIADNATNREVISYFCSLLKEPHNMSLSRVMEDNFCYNLKLEEYARLSSRSLSAFKRDFTRIYNIPPGKWLMEKRLNHALHLLTNLDKTVAEAAFESGFESASHFSRVFSLRFGRPPLSVKQHLVAGK